MRSPKKKPFSTFRRCSKFKVTNWSEYNNILRNRGSIDFMIAEDLSNGWYEDDTGLIYQDKFSLILLPFLYVAFKRHFVNNHDKHSLVFDTQY